MTEARPVLTICRLSLAFIWLYQGLVPKWLGPHPDERVLNLAAGVPPQWSAVASYAAGTLEIALGLAILLCYRRRWPYAISAMAMVGLFLSTAWLANQFLWSAFNATTANLSVLALSVIALLELQRPDMQRP